MIPINDDLAHKVRIGKFAELLYQSAENFSRNVVGFNSVVYVNQIQPWDTISLSSLLQYATAYVYRLSKLSINPEATAVMSLKDLLVRTHDEFSRYINAAPTIQQKLKVFDAIKQSGHVLYREPYTYNFYWYKVADDKAVEATISNIKANDFYWDYRTLAGYNDLPDELKNIIGAEGMQAAIINLYAV